MLQSAPAPTTISIGSLDLSTTIATKALITNHNTILLPAIASIKISANYTTNSPRNLIYNIDMFCERCGNKLNKGDLFCIECGQRRTVDETRIPTTNKLEGKWWFRLLKVAYIGAYLLLVPALLFTWTENSTRYDYALREYVSTPGAAFWASFTILLIYIAIMKTLRISFFYVALGDRAKWKREIIKFY
jgi:hypothetical protein